MDPNQHNYLHEEYVNPFDAENMYEDSLEDKEQINQAHGKL